MMRWPAIRAAGLAALLLWSGCDYEPTKSQYVSAVVRRECVDPETLQECRIEVIKRLSGVSLEELQRRYPPPPRPTRPSCSAG